MLLRQFIIAASLLLMVFTWTSCGSKTDLILPAADTAELIVNTQ